LLRASQVDYGLLKLGNSCTAHHHMIACAVSDIGLSNMSCCGCEAANAVAKRTSAQLRVLWLVLVINVGVFIGEFGAGWWASSTALQSDSLDSLGDALVYALSLIVAGRSLRARAGAAMVKGTIQFVFALAVLAAVADKLIAGTVPLTVPMAIAAGVALLANFTCFALLTGFRRDDVNMQSVWLCSRNDIVGNAGVLVIAGLIAVTGWEWLDPLFGAALALLFLHTAFVVLRAALPQFVRPSPTGLHERN
jgi:Co/Zn/Cd efflux system component